MQEELDGLDELFNKAERAFSEREGRAPYGRDWKRDEALARIKAAVLERQTLMHTYLADVLTIFRETARSDAGAPGGADADSAGAKGHDTERIAGSQT